MPAHRAAPLSKVTVRVHPSLAATAAIALIAHERYHTKTGFPAIMREIFQTIPHLTPEARSYLSGIIDRGWQPDVILGEHAGYGVPYTESIVLLGAVMSILAEFGEDPARALLESVQLGGDTDTTACIVLGAALIYPGAEIPGSLITDLEDGEYGIQFLVQTGDELNTRFPQSNTQGISAL